MKKWKCEVCGYIHTGEEPPDECPVCGADKSKFVEISLEEAAKLEPNSPKPKNKKVDTESTPGIAGFIPAQISKHHIHPISTHFPNGVLPFTVAFLFLAVFFQYKQLAFVAFVNLVGVVITMPMVLFSGYVDWKAKYGGGFTPVFVTKMVCGAVVLITGIFLVTWRIVNPEVAQTCSGQCWTYFFVHLIMLAAAGIAGYLGGELVFGADNKQ